MHRFWVTLPATRYSCQSRVVAAVLQAEFGTQGSPHTSAREALQLLNGSPSPRFSRGLMHATDRDWETWGANDPYYGVLTHDHFRKDTIAEHRTAFFASGTTFVAALLARYERHFGALPRDCVLDFGCGVGRLTLAFAPEFATVTGLDISPSMLAEAKRNAQQLAIANSQFLLSDDTLSQAAVGYDFVNSYIVLQHLELQRGLQMLRALTARVKPGGGCFLHVALKRRQSAAQRLKYWTRFHVPGANAAMNLAKRRPPTQPHMRMTEYDLTEVLEILAQAGMAETLLTTEDHDGVLTVGILARRGAPAEPTGVHSGRSAPTE